MDRSFPLCCVSPDSIFLWTLWLCLSFFIFLPLTFMSAPQFLLTLRLPSISWAIPIPGPLQNPLHPAPDWKSRAILETAPWSFFFSFQVIVYFQAIKRRSDTKEIEKGSSKSWGRFGWVSCAQASPGCATWKKRIGKGWDERKISSLEVQQSSWDLKVSARDQEFGKEWSERDAQILISGAAPKLYLCRYWCDSPVEPLCCYSENDTEIKAVWETIKYGLVLGFATCI